LIAALARIKSLEVVPGLHRGARELRGDCEEVVVLVLLELWRLLRGERRGRCFAMRGL
jgi:hypothetical protein